MKRDAGRHRRLQEGHRLSHSEHVILGIAAIAAMLGMMSLTINRLVRRKLRLSVVLLAAFVLSDLVLALAGNRARRLGRHAGAGRRLRAAGRRRGGDQRARRRC